MNANRAFSIDYRSARDRFRAATLARGFHLESHPIDDAADLTFDVAIGGDDRPRRLVVLSSGLHGVEGFLGSAIQNSILEDDRDDWQIPPGCGLVLLHALDPFGYANLRRADAANIDLNRNFVLDGDSYAGCPETYREIHWLLNPKRPPGWLDLLPIESIPALIRHGEMALRRAIAGGQYEFPLGLFFGGQGPSSLRIRLESEYRRWIGDAESVLHLDFHTGLGDWGGLTMLLEDTVTPERVRWIADHFVENRVEWWGDGIAYPTRGGFGSWCQWMFRDRVYDFLCAEFGTYSGRKVLGALRAENQAEQLGKSGSRASARAKRRMIEAFAPSDPAWRAKTLDLGRQAVRRAFAIAFDPGLVL